MSKFYSIIFLIFCSCKTLHGGKKPPCNVVLRNLERQAKTEWKYISEGNYYSVTDSLLKNIQTTSQNCLIGKDTIFIIATFGKHQNKDIVPDPLKRGSSVVGSIRYRLSPDCTCSNPRCNF